MPTKGGAMLIPLTQQRWYEVWYGRFRWPKEQSTPKYKCIDDYGLILIQTKQSQTMMQGYTHMNQSRTLTMMVQSTITKMRFQQRCWRCLNYSRCEVRWCYNDDSFGPIQSHSWTDDAGKLHSNVQSDADNRSEPDEPKSEEDGPKPDGSYSGNNDAEHLNSDDCSSSPTLQTNQSSMKTMQSHATMS